MKRIQSYQERFGFKVFEGSNKIDLVEEFDKLNSLLGEDDKWMTLVGAEFYDYGVDTFEDYIKEAGIENAEYIIETGKELTGEMNESWFGAKNDRTSYWKEMDTEERKAFLESEFNMSPEDLDEVYSDNIDELPEAMQDYFYDNDDF